MLRLAYSIILLLICSISSAGTIDPRVNDSKYVSYGSKFNFVAKLCGRSKDSTKFCGSAVAIHPNWVLTAAHVVEDIDSCEVVFDKDKFCISRVILSSRFKRDKTGYGDIALGYSEKEFGLDFYPALYTKKDEENKVCSISGFGLTGTFSTGATKSDDIRRSGSNIVDYIHNELLICNASTPQKATELEFLIASGDSGGGLFIDGKLAGINSCVLAVDKKPDSSFSDESGHTRVSVYFDWIMDNINEKKK